MATDIDEIQHYDASPTEVFSMFVDPAYIEKKCLASGSLEASSQIIEETGGKITIVGRRVLPAKVPSYAKRFIGETIVLTETQNWRPADADGSRAAGFVVDFDDQPISFNGSVELKPSGDGTTVETKGAIKCSVVFVGGKIEKLAQSWIVRFLAKEEKVGNEWLSGSAEPGDAQ
jgi:hypothetical protein